MPDEAPRKKRGGWCPVCEAEGEDPKHNYSGILCPKHYQRQRRSTEAGHQEYVRAYQKHNARKKQNRALGIANGWCPDCEAEGDDPRHSDDTIRCSKHHMRRYRQTERGAEVERRNLGKSKSPIVKAVKQSQTKEKNGND